MPDTPVNLIEIRDLIQTCAEEFRKYERNHRTKDDGSLNEDRRRDTLAKAEVNRLMAESCEKILKRLPLRSEIKYVVPEHVTLSLHYMGRQIVMMSGHPETHQHEPTNGDFEAIGILAENFIECIRGIVARKSFDPPRVYGAKMGAPVSKPPVDVRDLVRSLNAGSQ